MAEHASRVSYCTTCKGRLHHLKTTLPANLAAEADNPNVEFVVLDYGSDDGLGEWIQANFSEELKSGRLRYARSEQPDFRMSHAKNMAHRLASGDILCSLDADNQVAPGYAAWLSETFAQHPHSVVASHKRSRKAVQREQGRSYGGLNGRIAVSREDFYTLGGYDERYTGHGAEDRDFTRRAERAGLKRFDLPAAYYGDVVLHGNDERIEHLSHADQLAYQQKRARGKIEKFTQLVDDALHLPPLRANANGDIGCGEVRINFEASPTVIEPVMATAQAVTRPANWREATVTRGVSIHRQG